MNCNFYYAVDCSDLKCLDFPLAEELNYGTWRIDVNFKACKNYTSTSNIYTIT